LGNAILVIKQRAHGFHIGLEGPWGIGREVPDLFQEILNVIWN
jgi:hypothetical protein